MRGQSSTQQEQARDLTSFEAALRQQVEGMIQLLRDKRASYGPHNLTEWGPMGIAIRMGDKYKRLVHMYKSGMTTTAVGENLEDAWRDIVGYGLLALLLMEHGDRMYPEPLAEEDDTTSFTGPREEGN